MHSGDAEAVESLVYVLTRALPGTAAVVDYYGDSALHIAVQRYPLSHRLFQYLLLACPRLGESPPARASTTNTAILATMCFLQA